MAARIERISDTSSDVGCSIGRRLAANEAGTASCGVSRDRRFRDLIDAGLDRLPQPGHGATLQRWQALERVARHDLALVKWYEGHTDALAILRELEPSRLPARGCAYAVWASEARVDPITIRPTGATAHPAGDVRIDGRKSWCSGARVVDAALMTATDANGDRRLVEVRLSVPGITIDDRGWQAVGMRHSDSFDVVCDNVPARLVGPVEGYLRRPGFWHGGAGIAACWFGAAAGIGTRVRDLQVGRDDVHALAHLGAIDAALASGAALLREAATAIDAEPTKDAMRLALRVRGAIADLAEVVIHHAARAVGPGPLCNHAAFAASLADLPVFVRQSRAEHDLVAQGRALLAEADEMRDDGWRL